tara:strand:+ start:11 stop:1129 length:1119 start_codon:yes stop_codon:yes gene_type:complete
MLNKAIYLTIIIILFSLGFSKSEKLLNDGIILKQEPYSIQEIQSLKELYDNGNIKALETLIHIYKDKNQIYNIRFATLEILSNYNNPLIQEALEESITNNSFLDLELLYKSLDLLVLYEDIESTNPLIQSLADSENKIMDLREKIISVISENGTEDKILTLIDLYEVSMTNHSRMNELLSITLGNMDDDRSIPILMKIANDKTINIRIRNQAVEILSQKNAPELVDYFVELLGDPETNQEMTGFINNAMGDIHNDRMIMVLLESYQTGKNRYFANLNSIMEALKDYNNPQIKPAFIEIATSNLFPRLVRSKAINSLANFNDTSVLDYIIPILNNSENYGYYFDILNLAKQLNATDYYINMIRASGLRAMNND